MGIPQIKSAEELQEKADAYFQDNKTPTITGLAYHLGFESRQSFYDYEKRDPFSYTIKRLRLRMESIYEARLFENANAGAIFGLKNFGWSDKQEIDQRTTIQDNRIDESKLSEDDLRQLAEIQRKCIISKA